MRDQTFQDTSKQAQRKWRERETEPDLDPMPTRSAHATSQNLPSRMIPSTEAVNTLSGLWHVIASTSSPKTRASS